MKPRVDQSALLGQESQEEMGGRQGQWDEHWSRNCGAWFPVLMLLPYVTFRKLEPLTGTLFHYVKMEKNGSGDP